MKLNNIDKEIKKIADEYEIQPSDHVWDELKSKLDENQTDSKTKFRKKDASIISLKKEWYWIAASLIIVTISSLFYFKNQSLNDSFGISQQPIVTTDIIQMDHLSDEKLSEQNSINEQSINIEQYKSVQNESKIDLSKNHQEPQSIIKANSEDKLQIEKHEFKEREQLAVVEIEAQPNLFEKQVQQSTIVEDTLISDVDELLAQAMKRISDEQSIGKSYSSIDVLKEELLFEIENDLNKSFKYKVLQEIQTNLLENSLAIINK
ncbi:MAG: hypothetical protein ACE5RF_08305 [Nitrosarchaeum sp.]